MLNDLKHLLKTRLGLISNKTIRPVSFAAWILGGFASPAPRYVKNRILFRYGGSDIWVETGTYTAATTKFLCKISKYVHTIEPSVELHNKAVKKLGRFSNFSAYLGTSEEYFREVINVALNQSRTSISFWLDGHYSGPTTFRAKKLTPIIHELKLLEYVIQKRKDIDFNIFIDDIRGFSRPQFEVQDYPDLKLIVDWAESLGLFWVIEHDIFIAKTSLQI